MFQYTTWGREKVWIFQIWFLTPFCNQKRYFRIISQFYAQILTKNPQRTQISKNIENYKVFHKRTKYFNIQLGIQKYFLTFGFYF